MKAGRVSIPLAGRGNRRPSKAAVHRKRESTMSRLRTSLRALVGTAALAVGCAHTPPPAAPTADPGVTGDLQRVRAATRAFRDVAAAQAAGFPAATPPCLSNPSAGGMGHHYVNQAQVDGRLELEHPEILLYAPAGGGKMKLVAVEYIVPYRVLPPGSEAPRIFGQALRKSDQLKLWYLHVWAWETNSAGLFADWNPAVKCGTGPGM